MGGGEELPRIWEDGEEYLNLNGNMCAFFLQLDLLTFLNVA